MDCGCNELEHGTVTDVNVHVCCWWKLQGAVEERWHGCVYVYVVNCERLDGYMRSQYPVNNTVLDGNSQPIVVYSFTRTTSSHFASVCFCNTILITFYLLNPNINLPFDSSIALVIYSYLTAPNVASKNVLQQY